MSERRKIRLYAYMSSKGGVGKSTLAVTTAWLVATTPGREAVVLDLDMWGSSLGDGLPLRAPEVPLSDDSVLLFGEPPTGQLMSRNDTLRARHRRRFSPGPDGSAPTFLPYVNDALFVKAEGDVLSVPIDHFLWRFDGPWKDLPVVVMPSSPLAEDLSRVGAWMVDLKMLQTWAARVWWVVSSIITKRPSVTDIICDLPPGMVGLTLPFFLMLSAKAAGRPQPEGFPTLDPSCDVEVLPALVATPDKNALAVTAETFLARKAKSPGLSLIINRGQGGRDEVRKGLLEHFGPFFGGEDPYRLDRQCALVDERRELRLFQLAPRGLDQLDQGSLAALRDSLRVPEVKP